MMKIDLIIAGLVGFILGSFFTIILLSLLAAGGDDDDESKR